VVLAKAHRLDDSIWRQIGITNSSENLFYLRKLSFFLFLVSLKSLSNSSHASGVKSSRCHVIQLRTAGHSAPYFTSNCCVPRFTFIPTETAFSSYWYKVWRLKFHLLRPIVFEVCLIISTLVNSKPWGPPHPLGALQFQCTHFCCNNTGSPLRHAGCVCT
jgi:hypothetical protein